jgi:hypothetical protein
MPQARAKNIGETLKFIQSDRRTAAAADISNHPCASAGNSNFAVADEPGPALYRHAREWLRAVGFNYSNRSTRVQQSDRVSAGARVSLSARD